MLWRIRRVEREMRRWKRTGRGNMRSGRTYQSCSARALARFYPVDERNSQSRITITQHTPSSFPVVTHSPFPSNHSPFSIPHRPYFPVQSPTLAHSPSLPTKCRTHLRPSLKHDRLRPWPLTIRECANGLRGFVVKGSEKLV